MREDSIMEGGQQIKEYWEESIPWAFNDKPDKPFSEIRDMRYNYQDYMHDIFPFSEMANNTVVEIGAGAGIDAIEFAMNGADVIAIEPTHNGVNTIRSHASEAGVHIDAYQASGDNIPLTDGVADIVYSFGVLHHIPDISSVIDEIDRVLRDDGKFMGMVYNRDSLLNAYSIIYRKGIRDGGIQNYTPSELASLYSERHSGCPYTKLYTEDEIKEIFGKWFEEVKTQIRYNVIDTDRKRKVKFKLDDDLRLGWHIIIEASS